MSTVANVRRRSWVGTVGVATVSSLATAAVVTLILRRRRVTSVLRAGRSAWVALCNGSELAERLSDDMLSYLYCENDDEEADAPPPPLPASLKRLLTLLHTPEVLAALATAVNAGADKALPQLQKPLAESLGEYLRSSNGERLAVLVVRTAAREAIRVWTQRYDERVRKDGHGGVFAGGDLSSVVTPETLGEWLKNDSVRLLAVEVISMLVLNAPRRRCHCSSATATRHTTVLASKAHATSSNARTLYARSRAVCSARDGPKAAPSLSSLPSAASAASINAAAPLSDPGTELAERLILTAMQDRDLVRAVASESVRSYLTTKRELQQSTRPGTSDGRAWAAAGDEETNCSPLRSISSTLWASPVSSTSRAASASSSSSSAESPPAKSPHGALTSSTTSWWLLKTIARGSWQMISAHPSGQLL